MADWFHDVTRELQALILSTWTDVSANQLMTSINSVGRNLLNEAAGSLGGDATKIPPPYAILDMGKAAPYEESPNATDYRLPLKIYYIATGSGDSTVSEQEWVASKCNALLKAIQTGQPSTFQWVGDDGSIDVSEDAGIYSENNNLFVGIIEFENGLLTRAS